MAELVSAPLFRARWNKWANSEGHAAKATPNDLATRFRHACAKESEAREAALKKRRGEAARPGGASGAQLPEPFEVPTNKTILGWTGDKPPTRPVQPRLQPCVLWLFFRNDPNQSDAKELQAAWNDDNQRGPRSGARPPPPAAKKLWKPDLTCEPASGEADLVRFHILECEVAEQSPHPALMVHLSHGPWSTPLEATTDGLPAAKATLRLKRVTLVPAVKGAVPVRGTIFQDPPWHYGTAWTREFDPLGNGLLLDGEVLARYQVTGGAVSIRLSVCCEFDDLDARIANPPADATAMDLRVAERALQVLRPKEKRTLYVLAEGALLPPGRKK